MTASSTLTVRPSREDDREALVRFCQELNVHELAVSGDRKVDRATAEFTLDGLEQRLAERRGCILIAEWEGRAVGFLGWCVDEGGVYVTDDVRLHGKVTDLFVAAGFRGRGIGKALLRAAEALTRELGLKRLSIGVLAGNEAAERAYANFGFAPYAAILQKTVV